MNATSTYQYIKLFLTAGTVKHLTGKVQDIKCNFKNQHHIHMGNNIKKKGICARAVCTSAFTKR